MVRRLCGNGVAVLIDVYVNVNRHHATPHPARGRVDTLIVNPWRAGCGAAR
jgi:hypothetical protein